MRSHCIAATFALLTLTSTSYAQSLVVTGLDNNTTNANLLADSLLGAGITRVGNASLQGINGQQGTFTTTGGGASGVVGFRDGILLTSGLAALAAGPNDTAGATGQTGSGSAPEIPDGIDTNVLEFQFTVDPNVTNLRFSYVFASEEYPEFVNQFNDGFGLFINGTNVAIVPGTPDTPVTINNINATTNSEYYVDNTSSALDTQYDGLTTLLTTADITSLLNGGTNTLRIVIADRGDGSYDSGVFVKAGSFTQGGGTAAAAPEPGSIALLGMGLFGMGGLGIVRRRAAKH